MKEAKALKLLRQIRHTQQSIEPKKGSRVVLPFSQKAYEVTRVSGRTEAFRDPHDGKLNQRARHGYTLRRIA